MPIYTTQIEYATIFLLLFRDRSCLSLINANTHYTNWLDKFSENVWSVYRVVKFRFTFNLKFKFYIKTENTQIFQIKFKYFQTHFAFPCEKILRTSYITNYQTIIPHTSNILQTI